MGIHKTSTNSYLHNIGLWFAVLFRCRPKADSVRAQLAAKKLQQEKAKCSKIHQVDGQQTRYYLRKE
jgi:hypothetical protein